MELRTAWPLSVSGLLPLARLLRRIHRNRNAQVERGPDDPGLLHGVRGRVALARRGALRPADVAELDVGRQDLQQARRHVRAGAHVARLLLHPHDLAQVRVALDLLEDLRLRERIEELDPGDRDALVVLAGRMALEVVVELARAE